MVTVNGCCDITQNIRKKELLLVNEGLKLSVVVILITILWIGVLSWQLYKWVW